MNARDQKWLEAKLAQILQQFFADVEIKNNLIIRYGKRGKRQLGSIAKKHHPSLLHRLKGEFDSVITLNGYFRDPAIPEYVVDGTLIHELCHYAHGFSSPLPQLSRYPHQGGMIKQEMIKRGAGDIYLAEKKWLKHNWQEYLKMNYEG